RSKLLGQLAIQRRLYRNVVTLDATAWGRPVRILSRLGPLDQQEAPTIINEDRPRCMLPNSGRSLSSHPLSLRRTRLTGTSYLSTYKATVPPTHHPGRCHEVDW